MEQSVPKRRHIKFRRQGISQKKAYNKVNSLFNLPCFHLFRRQETHFSKHLYTQTIIRCMSTLILNPRSLWSPPPYGATVRGGLWPLLQYASRSLGSLLYLCLRLYPSFSGPWTRHPAISFLVFLFVLLHTAFRTASFWDCGVLHSFYMPKPSYSLAFNKPDNLSLSWLWLLIHRFVEFSIIRFLSLVHIFSAGLCDLNVQILTWDNIRL